MAETELTKTYGPAFWDDPQPSFFTQEGPRLDAAQQEELAHHLIFHTSGTTGHPKGIALSKSALLASAQSVNQHLKVNSSDHWLLALPYDHVGGFGIIARAFQAQIPLSHFDQKWNPQQFTASLTKSKATLTSLVPTQLHDLVQAKLPAPKNLRAILVGGGHLTFDLHEKAHHLGWPLYPSFGMTEAASQIATASAPTPGAPLQILPHWETKTDPHDILSIEGPALFSGTLTAHEDYYIYEKNSRWFQTNDRVQLNPNNTLTPIGRTDSLVKVLGELVDLSALEKELSTRAQQEIIITAQPDQRRQNNLQPHSENTSLLPHKLIDDWNEKAAGYLRLETLKTHPTFPRTKLGKVIRREL